MSIHSLWVEKYRPPTIDGYIFHDPSHKLLVERLIHDRSIPHLLLSGIQGCGKSTLARILINAIGVDPADVLSINISSKRGIDTFRDEITSFATTVGMGDYKVIHLEEAGGMTPDAQNALKAFMEDQSDFVRFIFTCNNSSLIIPPIRSRCQELHFKTPNIDDVTWRMVNILQMERIKADIDTVDQYVALYYPDVRKIINAMQQGSSNGTLQPVVAASSGEYRLRIIDLISAGKWVDARALVVEHLTTDQWEDFYRFMYSNIHKASKFSANSDQWNQAILIIAEHLYRHAFVADPEINAAAMFIELSTIK